MVKGIDRLDLLNKRVYLGTEAGVLTTYTTQEVYSYIKEELQISAHIDQDKISIASGNETYDPASGATTGVVLTMQDGWTLWTEDQGAKHRLRITAGLVLDSVGGDPLGTPTNIVWSVSEQAVSNVGNLTTLESNQDNVLDLLVNDSEWVAPGVVNVYDDNGKTGGVVIYQWRTYDNDGIQSNTKAPKRLERVDPPIQP